MQSGRDFPDREAALAQLAHDLRNSLATLKSVAHLLARAVDRPEVFLQMRAALDREIDRMQQLIDVGLENASPDQAGAMSDAASAEVEERPMCGTSESDSVKKILVADDNQDAAKSLAMMLRFEGYEVVTAHDGNEALLVAEATHPDILLLDLSMPIRDGFEVAKAIQSRSWSRHCKLIAVSGWARAEDRDRTRAAGFHGHLTKPLDVDALGRVLAD